MAKRFLMIDCDTDFWLSIAEGTIMVGSNPHEIDATLSGLHIVRIRCEVDVDEEHGCPQEPAPLNSAPELAAVG